MADYPCVSFFAINSNKIIAEEFNRATRGNEEMAMVEKRFDKMFGSQKANGRLVLELT